MDELDCFGADDPNYIGFDYMSLLKGAGGLLSGVSEGFGGKGGGGGGGGAAAAAAVQQEAARRQAEQSASTMKMVLLGVLGLVGVGGIVFLARK